MDSFIFSINAVVPIITLTALGYILRRVRIISPEWASLANKLCYRTFLPVLLFMNIYNTESLNDIDWNISVYALAGITFAFCAGWLLNRLFKIKTEHRGVVWQAVFRSNFAILGMPLAIAMYGTGGGQAVAVLSLLSIPAFNIMAIIALRGRSDGVTGSAIKGIVKSIITNPLIIGVFLGFLALAVRQTGTSARLTDIPFIISTATSMSQVASPLMLVCLGAQFNFQATRGLLKPLLVTVLSRLILIPLIVLGAAFLFFPGFYGAGFVGLIALFASPVAVSASVMAVEMGGDAELSSQTLFWSTSLSAVTIFVFVLIFKSLGAL